MIGAKGADVNGCVSRRIMFGLLIDVALTARSADRRYCKQENRSKVETARKQQGFPQFKLSNCIKYYM